jgi:hypothetical protein
MSKYQKLLSVSLLGIVIFSVFTLKELVLFSQVISFAFEYVGTDSRDKLTCSYEI